MRPWQFGKPKTPGFGLSNRFYLSVLSSRSVMPALARTLCVMPRAYPDAPRAASDLPPSVRDGRGAGATGVLGPGGRRFKSCLPD